MAVVVCQKLRHDAGKNRCRPKHHNMPWFDLMSIDAIFIIVIGAAFGGLVNGLAGFGTGLFALGWWLQVLPPTSAVALVVILSFVSGVQGVFAVRQALNWPRRAGS